MKLHLMFLLMNMLLFLACGYLWLKSTFAHAMHRRFDLPNHKRTEVADGRTKEEA